MRDFPDTDTVKIILLKFAVKNVRILPNLVVLVPVYGP